jgi:hypothetical protein
VVSLIVFIVVVSVLTVLLSVLVVLSPLLLQATKAPAITITPKNFFIARGFIVLKAAKIVSCSNNTNFGPTNFPTPNPLFLSKENSDRHSREIEVLPKLILKVVLVGSLNIVRKIAEEGE